VTTGIGNTITPGDSDDRIIAESIKHGVADMGLGNDTVRVSTLISGASLDTGDGDDRIVATSIQNGALDTGAGDDTLDADRIGATAGGSANVAIETGDGTDTVKASWIGWALKGNATVSLDTGGMTIGSRPAPSGWRPAALPTCVSPGARDGIRCKPVGWASASRGSPK
jgi:hypothetical protein